MSFIHHLTSLFDSSAATQQAKAGPLSTGSLAAKTLAADDTTTSTTTSTDSTSSGTITASDFLTLLVTELKNQDPTSDQDPNAYITQLVGVNSLQQLIAINQDLSSASSSATTGSTSSVAGPVANKATGAAANSGAPSVNGERSAGAGQVSANHAFIAGNDGSTRD